MYRKKGRGWTKHIDFMLIDIACIVIAFLISYVIRFGFNNPYVDKDYRILCVAFLLIDFFVEIMADSFKNVMKRGYLDEFISTCKHAVLVFMVTALFLFTTQMADIYSRLSFYIMFPIYVTITYAARLALKSFLKKKDFGASKKSLFVIAPDAILRDTLCTVEKSCIGYTKIVAASLDTDMKGETICGIPIVANHDGIVDYACDEWVDEVLIPPCSEDEYPEKMADIFLEMGIAVHTGIAKNGTAQGGYKQIEKIGDYTVVTSSENYANPSALLVKRGMDIVGGLVGCLFTLIIMIFVGPAIYIASPGPIFFAQERVGRNGRKFKMYKFRSMYMDAEERKKELAAQNKVGDGMMFKMDFDPRIIGNKVLPNGKKKTGIGQFIRKTSLDEFPQFFNILVGDMSLVGTRPPTLDEWEKYEPHHRARMSFRPGLTGLWQVSGNALFTLISGFVSDKFGRKVTIVAMSCSALTCYLLFIFSGMFKWTPYLTGFAIGGFMGSYWGAGDTIGGIMFSESTPTNLRSSVTVINTLLNGVMGGLATVITMILLPIIPERMFGYMYLGLTVPGLVGAIVIMWLFVGETRGLDLKTVTGTEWDKPKKVKEEQKDGE